jgi:chemotaxis protein MotB
MSVVDANKFRAIADSFQDRAVFDFYPSLVPFENPAEDRDVKVDPYEEEGDSSDSLIELDGEEMNEQLDLLLEEVEDYLETNNLQHEITVSRDDRGVVLVLQEQALFKTAKADIIKDAEPFLGKVGTLLNGIPHLVKVEGHTDSRPINTAQYPSNWELSGARASSVIRFLISDKELEPGRFIAIGYGDTRPVAPNTTADNLQKNRRVVIVISDPAYEKSDLY